MTREATFGRKFVREITLNLPAQLMTDYYFRVGKKPRPMTYSGGDIYLGRLPTRLRHAVRIEADKAGYLRAIFTGAALGHSLADDQSSRAVADCADVTPWFDYQDRLMLAQLVDARIRMVN